MVINYTAKEWNSLSCLAVTQLYFSSVHISLWQKNPHRVPVNFLRLNLRKMKSYKDLIDLQGKVTVARFGLKKQNTEK